MKIKTVQSPSYNNQMSELNRRISRLEAILNGAPIADAKISSIKWNKAVGGTATLGGVDNGNGVLEVKDELDETKVIVDKDGIQINDGKLSIQNDSGNVSIDAKGIVSAENFFKSEASNGSLNQTISGTSETDITGSSITFTVDRPTIIIVLFSTSNRIDQSVGNTGNLTVRLKVRPQPDDSFYEYSRIVNSGVPISDSSTRTYTNYLMTTASSGTKTIKLTAQLESVVGNPTALIHIFNISYVLLGK